MAVSAVSASLQVQANLTCSLNQTPLSLSPTSNNSAFSKKLAFVLGGNLAGGINQCISTLYTPAASASSSIDLTAQTNVLGQGSITLARVKAIMVWLLSTTDDATNGTACTSVQIDATVTNGWASQSHSGWLQAVSIEDIPNGAFKLFGLPGAAGVLVDSTHKILKITNNDGANAAAILVTIWAADA